MTIIAHRGASRKEPENTLRAFRRAIELGGKWIECDVRVTRDRVPVVIHDATVNRTTNGKGHVSRMTNNELRVLEAGKGERVPTLKETLQFAQKNGIQLVLEIKDPSALEPTLDLVQAYSHTPLQLIISSFSPSVLRRAKTLAPHLPTAVITTGILVGKNSWVSLARQASASVVCVHARMVSKPRLDAAHRAGLKVFAWTVNSLKYVQRLEQFGIDGIFTNYPELLVHRV